MGATEVQLLRLMIGCFVPSVAWEGQGQGVRESLYTSAVTQMHFWRPDMLGKAIRN